MERQLFRCFALIDYNFDLALICVSIDIKTASCKEIVIQLNDMTLLYSNRKVCYLYIVFLETGYTIYFVIIKSARTFYVYIYIH